MIGRPIGIANDETPLLGGEDTAKSLSRNLGRVILGVQIAVAAVLFALFTFDDAEVDSRKYIVFRDIMVMLLLGFGYCECFSLVVPPCFLSPKQSASY